MRGYVIRAVVICFLCSGGIAALPSESRAADAGQQAVLQADHALSQALDSANKAEAAKLLDADFTWIFSDGREEAREDVLRALPKPILKQQNDYKVTERTYGEMALVAVDRGSTHVLHVWVQRPEGWRALHFNEIVQSAKAAPGGAAVPSEAGVTTPCVNPCKSVPVKAATPETQAALTALQQLDTGSANRDMKLWASRVLDDCLIVDSTGTRPITKAERIAITLKQKATGTDTNEAPPLVWARMYDFGGSVLMLALHQPYKSKPYYATRVWVNQGGRYQLAASYHTTIEDVPAFTLLEQLPQK